MNAADLIAALDLPPRSLVDRRVPKTLLVENGAPTAADKRHINEGVEEIFWLAALKPTTVGVPEYRDAVREYLEIAVLRVNLRGGAKRERLVELTHRAIPYPVMLIAEQGAQLSVSLAHKRWSQGEAGKTVLDGEVFGVEYDGARVDQHAEGFHDALALGRQPRTTLFALYQGWLDTLLAFQAARLTGAFAPLVSAERAAARRDALHECTRLETEIARLRAAAAKEKQISRQVELNLELKRVEAARAAALAKL